MRHTSKGQRFESIIARADAALENNYCIEASTLYYALLEERLISIFEKFNIRLNKQQKMFYCIDEIKKFIQNGKSVTLSNGMQIDVGPLLGKEFDIQLLDDMDNWRNRRNSVIHDFAKQSIPYSDVEDWAEEGKNLVRKFNSGTMRLKRNLQKYDPSI
ncbi:hypothetical protein ABEY65_27795 [Priestia aryabhattai]|uniref:hypothetical protein n=1 Tax=Priestia aryabhattai TaxID=412384 RepID=UPI003D2CD942